MDAEAPRDVVRRRHDAAPARIAPDHERPRAQRRVLQLLDGCEERVEIQMGEYPHDRPRLRFARDRHAAPARATCDRAALALPGLLRHDRGPRASGGAARGRPGRRPNRPQATAPRTAVRGRRRPPPTRGQPQGRDGRRARRSSGSDDPPRLRASARSPAASPRRAARQALEAEVRRLATRFPGTAAVYVENLTSGAAAAWNARATFPAASTLKLAIAVTLLTRVDGPPGRGRRWTGSSAGCSTHRTTSRPTARFSCSAARPAPVGTSWTPSCARSGSSGR